MMCLGVFPRMAVMLAGFKTAFENLFWCSWMLGFFYTCRSIWQEFVKPGKSTVVREMKTSFGA